MYQRVLVGTDGSPTASRAVEAAARVARAHGAALVVGHAFPPRLTTRQERDLRTAPDSLRWRLTPGAMGEEVVRAAVERARVASEGVVAVRGRAEPGDAVAVMLALVAELDPDVLVIGNRDMPGRLPLRRSVARALSRRATCDIVIVDTIGRRHQRRERPARTLRWA